MVTPLILYSVKVLKRIAGQPVPVKCLLEFTDIMREKDLIERNIPPRLVS